MFLKKLKFDTIYYYNIFLYNNMDSIEFIYKAKEVHNGTSKTIRIC